ncbi:LPD38 domain-containing protein [Prevotella sp.]|uniref:LPD38 domain-containing protein n=1 Tax=Prevotella sp. TaxID=59823 RepID=UPI0027E24BC2|nr:LPD38 domain-containing protein [Prevotella sp.]
MADDRYYYFKDAKGNKHTVDKTAYDKDPMGFAKAFPGARMEVIDRKTGRRGDVDVRDAGRVGDFGAHLFTGRTVRREKGRVKSEKSNGSALGRAQEMVAQQKWGGYGSEDSTSASAPMGQSSVQMDAVPTGKESELVKGLRAADAMRKRDEEQMPIDYTKPGAVKQMVGGARRAQKALERRMEQAGQEVGRNAEGEIRRRNAPAFDLGNENVNNNLVKTRGQLEDELEESSRQLVDKQLGGYINNSIQKMFKDATVKGVAAEDVLSKASPFAYMVAGKAYNEALDPDKLMNQLSKNAEKDMAGLFSDPKMQKEIVEKAASLGIDPEDYVKNYIAPGLQAKIAEEFEKSELSRNMPKSTAEYIIRGVNDSMIGTILSMGMMSKKQRQYAQQGMAMTDNGENPYVKPGMGARVARGILGFGADGPVFGVLGKGGAWVAGKAFGNGVAQAARIANTSLAGRIGRMVGTGAVSQGVTGVLYGSTNAAVQNYSTGDDTSIGNTVKLMTMGGLSEGASWATMGGIGGAVGAGIYNVSGVKRIPAKVFQIAMEGVGMHMGGNVAKMIEGHDTDWLSVEGNLEACANVVALKLTHARLPKRQVMDGKKESYLDMVARNIKNLMTSDGQRAAFGGYTFTNEEKEQLFGSDKAPKREETLYGYDVHDNPLTRKESLTSWAMRTKKTAAKGKGEESYKDTDTEFVKTAYDEIMTDETIPWDTKAKFSALVMGTVPSARPMMDHLAIERDEKGAYVGEYSLYGELLSKNRYKTADEYVSIKYNLGAKKENQRLSNAYGAAQIKDEKAAQETLETVAETFGFTAEQLKAAMDKDPLKRSEEEQNACVALRKAYEGEQFPEGTLHPEQSQTEGKDVVEENNLGTENPNNEAVAEVLGKLTEAEDALQAAMDGNDVFKQEYERLKNEGLSNPQIYMELINSGLTQEQLAPLADYINAKAKAVGMYRGTEQKIAETVQKHVEQWSYKGELNGEKQEGGQMLFVKDNNGRLLIVGAGDVAFDSEGRARENVGDMLSVLDPNTKEMDFVSKKDVQLDHVEKTEDYAKNYQEMLEVMNSVAYAESEKVKEKSEKSDTKTESVVTPKEGASAPGVEDVKPIGEGEKKNPSDNGNGSNETLTFADGSPVPMMKDTKGRETADYSQMTPEQGAEWMSSQFGENAEAAVDGQIMRAEKMLKEAEKIKVDYTGDLNDAKEAEAQKAKAVDAAKAELELYTNIKKVMTANKVKAGMEKVGSVGEEGSVSEAGNLGAVREKFESGKRIVGNKRTRTLADGSKLRGHYEIVEADSLTPSHNANDGYKKSEGFPVNEEGRTINDRDYENDKQAQLVTDMIAMKYDGQAVDQVPVVTSDGIVVDGNGRTMAGQKAAKNGTDSAYLEALKENAENYGFTAEQIEQSGIKHPRLVLVSDEPMKYDTATFAKFNKNEKKSQGNTQQAVANSKKLSADEIGTIISEIEGSGSLDAFFNNPTAINSLLKRLIDKGVIGLNEVAGLREGEDKLSAAGKDFVKNLLLGSVFSENTIRMMGADAMLKTKALNGIRAVTDNMKLGDYALMKEIDQAVQLLYEARQGGSGVDAYLRTPAMFGENAADRYDPISQAIALALEGKAEDFRELMMAYNRNAAPYADANQMEMFGERPTNEEFIKEFLKLRNWKDYETRHSSKEGNGDAGSTQGSEPETSGGNEPTEGEGLAKSGDKTLERKNIDDVSTEENGGPLEGDKEGKPENDNGGSPDRDVQARKGQREVDKAVKRESEKGKEKSEESDSKVEGVVTPSGTIKERKQSLLEEIDRGGITRKDDALMLLSKAEDLVDDYYGVPHNEWKREPSRNNTIDTILGWAKNTLEKIKDEPIELATEKQKSYIEKLNDGDRTTQKMLESVELNKRQASWLINQLKYVNENLMHMTREAIEDAMKEIHDGIEHFKKVNGKPAEPTKPKGEEPSKTNPLAWLAHTAEMFKDEQVQKAKEELTKAKESGDASDIKRATADMKQAMETKLRGNGIGLVERRRIIGRELGKILGGEAGKAEAEKIDKPWEQMDLEEREAVSSKNPLTETEINELTSEENRELIPAALAYLRGDKGNIINAISYFKIWNDVRSRHENVPDNSGAKDGTQLDAPDTGGSQELGLGRGREGGRPDGPVDRTDSERTTPGERESGTSGENDTPVSTGKPSVDKGEGNTPGMDAVSAGSTDTRGGSRLGNEGNVPKRGGQGGGNRPLDPNARRKPAAKQGTHFPDSTSERLKQERAEYEQKKKDFWERWKKAGQGYMKISLTPFKALNLSPEQIEMLPELFKMHLNGAVLKIKEGIYKFNEWKAAMRAEEGEELKMIGLSDDDIDRFIEDYWNTPYQMDGETHTIGEWAGIHGNEKLREKLSEPLNDKYQRQIDAEPIKVKIGDKKNIEETLPYLLPQQQEDVLKAETQFFGNEHADREHAYGKGYMFTNGTGTGKTFTGLGIAKRLVKQGKGRILIVTPSQKKVSDWIKDGHNLNMEIRDLDSIAKERGTTATTESGEGVVITTFANFGVNKKLLEEKWDAVIYDESHRIMENKNGAETARSMQHYMVTNRSENHCFLRLQEINKDYQKMKSLGEQFNAERDKEVKRIQDEYKASHPSATARDISYATSKTLPKEIINFTPGDYASFPKLGEIHSEFKKAFSHYINEVMPKLEAQAKSEWKDTKTIFLSATPFNTRENLDYAEGYIFKYPEVEKGGRMSGRTQFYLDHFGAAYKFRYGRLEQSTSNPEAVAKQEIAFSDYLQDTLGTMSGRIIDSPYDYSRDFPTVSPDHAEQFNQAVQDAVRGHGVLADAYRRTIGDYNYGSALFETMKVANIIERIKAHLDAGRKVVIFHRRVETKEPLKPPFALMLEQANHLVSIMSEGKDKKEAAQAVRDFRKKYADLLKWEQTLDYSMPREQIAKVFGKDNVLFFSGKESTKVKDKAVDTFNDDNSGKNIIVIQEASGKEGISLHDKTGKHQRVCITLALPQSPITALQIEGRTYRIGNKSNAIFEYPILGLNSEMMLFGEKFNNQVSTTENLALGSKARSLRDSFAKGILEHSGVVPIDQQGVGGKEFDAPKEQNADPYDDAVLDYYSNQKLNSRNREGVDYFPTPEPLGYKMVEWANMGEGDTAMEPSAGHGAIARYVPKGNQMTAIEPSQSLFTKLQLKAGGLGRKFVNTIFENYDLKNKHDVVVMNPPFGTAGATAIAHLGKAFKHLEEGGRVVALIPRGSTDKKFDKWIEGEKTAVLRAEVELPDIVFKQAGTKVVCRVVVVDKISNEAMRAKAGRAEKWNLGEHYDKIEDFFEDLRDVKIPDRIIDTNAIMRKKSKQTVKDLEELKGVTVDMYDQGINVEVRGDWKDYGFAFNVGGYTAEQKKKHFADTYETLEQQERQTRNETSQAVIAELKKLSCKLAGMTEEEMQRYLRKQNEGKNVMYRVEHAAEVYNKAKGDGSKGLRDGRVVPEDVDKKTSEGIEKKFDEEIGEVESDFDSKEEFMQAVSKEIHLASRYRKSVLENQKKRLENELRRKESNTSENSEGAGTGRLTSADVDNKTTLQGHRNKAQDRIALVAINRELDYRRVRAENLRNTYGLSAGSEIGFGEIEKIFRQLHTSPELGKLFTQTRDVLKRLGVDFGVQDEINSGKLTSPMGYASPERDIRYSIDGLVKTSSSKAELPVTILHEMIHEGVNGAIHLVKSGKADGMLTPKQIEAVETISEIYDRAIQNQEKFKENNYGLEDEYEFAAQMADPRQRKALDLGVMDRVVNFAKELIRKGDRSVWERVKDAVKKLFEVSDKSKMDKAIEDILSDFNKTVDDAAMADVEDNGWGYDKGVVTPEKTSGASNAMSERIIKTVEKVAKRTGGKVKMVNSVEEIENQKVRKDIEKGKQVTGWYDEKTGEVHLYMPNIHDTYTAEKTVWHETVGHKGMRGLLGDKFDSYMRDLWMDLDNPINAELRAYVKEKMNMNHLGFYDAIEEFIAKSAEDGKGEPGFWNYIKNKVTDALHEIGYRVSPNVKDVKYMLWLAKNVQKHGDSPLWKMRAEAVKWKIEHEKTLSVVEDNGMMYDNNGKKHGLLDLNKKDFDEATDGHVHYRTSPMTASKIEEYNRRLSTKWYAFKESTVDDMQSLQEAMQIISGVKDAYTDIPSAFNPLQCHNRMGSMVMQMCERYDREYTEPLGNAFKKVVSAMPGKDGAEQTRNANLYFIKKHGLERNRVLFVRDWFRKMEKTEGADSEGLDNLDKAWKGERSDLRRALDSGQIDLREYYRQMDEWIVQNLDKDFKAEEHDYSGMHGIYDVKKGEEYDDANVIDEVMSTESQLGADLVKSFWDAKKKATDFTIDQEYANGFKDKNERDHLKEMFDWYVPLRKFDDTVAEDVYGYISGDDTKNDIGSVIEKARGRESLSDVNVLAQISALAKSSILNGGKNVERQHFMRFVEAYEKGDAKDRIFVEIKPWVEKHIVDGNEVWEEVMPNIPENSTQEQINDILNTFEETMKAKQAHGEAKIARRKSDIGYKFERSSDMNQHIINVYVNGRVRRFVCQGNPRAAQAINGMLRDSGTRGWVSEKSAELNRFCAQLNTSLNPDFISSNLMRDLTFASANLTKEGMGYTWDFCMEYAKNWASMARRKDGSFDGGYLGMFRHYKEGRLDANNQKERWFKEFMDNGGETGFVSLKKYEDIIKEYENLVKTGNKEGDRWLMKKLKEGGVLIELANEVVENVARYSTYCVSRKRGRSIGKSIYDAKEVSSNFNRHGSGDAIKNLKTEYDGKTDIAFRNSLGWFNSYMKNHTMFYNAGVQGANLFTKNLKHAPKTVAIAFGAMPFGLNIAVALLNQLLISQEDEKKRNGVKNPYAELPEWKRRNNLCIYWGGGKFKTIPMGIELRAFYGLGDIAAGYMVDESLKSDTPIGLDIIGQMAQLVPASDFLGHHSPSSGIKELGEDVILSVIPTTAKPELELAFNRDWTGRPIYRDNDYLDKAPRWKRAYDSTSDAYMTINKWANKTFNGIDNTNEDLKGSGMMADAVDFFTAPYGLQHIVEGYTGGTGATIGRTYQTGKSLVKGVVSGVKDEKGFAEGFNKEWDKVNPNTIPFYRVFNYTPKEGNDMQRTKSKWYNYVDELEQLKYNMQQMKTNTPDTAKNIHNAASKFKFSQSKEGRKLKIYEAADRYITAKRRILKRAKDKAVVEAVNEAINRKMQEAVEDLDRIE